MLLSQPFVVTLLIAIPFFKLPVGIASGQLLKVSSKVSSQSDILLLWQYYYIRLL